MDRVTVSVVCPHCEAGLDVRVELRAAVVPPLKLQFRSLDELTRWLRASRLTLQEFERLPVYEWYRDEFEPLLDALRLRQAAVPAARALHKHDLPAIPRVREQS